MGALVALALSSEQPGPRWRFLLRPRWLGWHACAILAAAGMLRLGAWQLHRAQAGNGLSWAYTFEWPLFAVLGAAFWAKTILDEFRSPGSARDAADESDAGDPEGTAYRARLSAEVRGHGRWHGLR
jgi:hypothetical protein